MKQSYNSNKIFSVVVLYWPDHETIRFIEQLAGYGWSVIAVVNGIEDIQKTKLKALKSITIIENKENLGLARALNQGCERAFSLGAAHVFLLDQDSRPTNELPDQLLIDFISLKRAGRNIAAIGPTLVDVKCDARGIPKTEKSRSQFLNVDTIATSGSLIPKSAFEMVGNMCEWLFVDGIDHEWCFRAKHRGLEIIKSDQRYMDHNMGDDGITLLGRYRPLHRSPIRHFYITRNSIFLIKQAHISLIWRTKELFKILYRSFIYIMISSNKIQTLKNICSGVYQGIFSVFYSKNGQQ